MNRNFMRLPVVLLFVWSAAGAGVAAAQTWSDFSADVLSDAGGQTMQGRIFVAKDKTRMETPQSIMITRLDRNVVWILMPAQNAYMEQPLDPTTLPKVSKEMPGETERVLVGPETVNGEPAQKYKISYTQAGRQDAVYQWMGRFEVPLKIEAVDGSWSMEYRNIQEGPQDDSLFEIPAGYQTFAMPVMPGNLQAMSREE